MKFASCSTSVLLVLALARRSSVVTDNGHNRVQVFDLQVFDQSGEVLFEFGSPGTGEGEFHNPIDLVVDNNGRIVVLDAGNSRVQVFDPNGEFLFQFGSSGTGEGEFSFLAAVTTDIQDNIIVLEAGSNARVQVFDSNGEFLHQFGSVGSSEGELNTPIGVATNSENNIISDAGNNRVQVFDRSVSTYIRDRPWRA
jgi:DNA-binding beta-propeller fold protein YncE